MKGGFNSSFIEIRTLEGDKFIKDLKIGESILSNEGYDKVKGVFKREAKPNENVYNIYYHGKEKEGVLDRISGDQVVCTLDEEGTIKRVRVSDLKVKDHLLARTTETSDVEIDRIEKMETINRFFYNIYIGNDKLFCADNIYIESGKI